MPSPEGSARLSSTAVARKQRKSRGRGLRTTTGCTICRKRHMKCDEVKPVCGQCARGSRPCAYDTDAALPVEPIDLNDGTSQASRVPERAPPRTPSDVPTDPYPWPREELRLANTQNDDSHYATETAPVRWFGLLSTNTADVDLDIHSRPRTNDSATHEPERLGYSISRHRPDVMQFSAIAPSVSASENELRLWKAQEPVQLEGLEHDMYEHFVTVVSMWIDLLDPMRHFSTVVPHLAVHNVGLMKAILALGARHLEAGATPGSCEVTVFGTAAVQYYSETLQYLQTAMRYISYKNSLELLATTLVISAYEMLDGAGKGWKRHLKGVFWIQRSRGINGESGGLEQAVWWAWHMQDVWAAFEERRRCFSFWKPARSYSEMGVWEVASRAFYILAQCVNFVSEEDKRASERDPQGRTARANELSQILDEWYAKKGGSFTPLPLRQTSDKPFEPLWLHPPAFAVSIQAYHVARILLLSHKPAKGGYQEYLARDREISTNVDAIAGIAMRSSNDASRPLSTKCLYTAGLFCSDEARRKGILEVLEKDAVSTVWSASNTFAEELRTQWARTDQR